MGEGFFSRFRDNDKARRTHSKLWGTKTLTVIVLGVGLLALVTSCRLPFWQEAEFRVNETTTNQAQLEIEEGIARMKISAQTRTGMYILVRMRFEVTFSKNAGDFTFRPGLLKVSLEDQILERESGPVNSSEWSVTPEPGASKYVLPAEDGSEWHIYSGISPDAIPYDSTGRRIPWQIKIEFDRFAEYQDKPVQLDPMTILGF